MLQSVVAEAIRGTANERAHAVRKCACKKIAHTHSPRSLRSKASLFSICEWGFERALAVKAPPLTSNSCSSTISNRSNSPVLPHRDPRGSREQGSNQSPRHSTSADVSARTLFLMDDIRVEHVRGLLTQSNFAL